MIINHNMSAMYAQRQFKLKTLESQKNIEKLSSGMRINRGRDDAAGLAVSEKMRSQIRGLNQASRNAQDGISLIQTADGWLGTTHSMLHRMRELAVQAANGIYTFEDRVQLQQELKQLVDEVDRVASTAEFNTLKLLRGGFRRHPATPETEQFRLGKFKGREWDYEKSKLLANPPVRPLDGKLPGGPTDIPSKDPSQHVPVRVSEAEMAALAAGGAPAAGGPVTENQGGAFLHIGPNMDHREQFYIENMSAYSLGLAKGDYKTDAEARELHLDYLSQDGANRAIGMLDSALFIVAKQRADLGAYQNRLEFTVRNLDNAAENLQAAESQIRDVDMANEMVDFVKNQILSQSSASMLAQANLRPQVVLRVLG